MRTYSPRQNGAHQSIEIQQDIALPRSLRLCLGSAIHLCRVAKEKHGAVEAPFLVLCNSV